MLQRFINVEKTRMHAHETFSRDAIRSLLMTWVSVAYWGGCLTRPLVALYLRRSCIEFRDQHRGEALPPRS